MKFTTTFSALVLFAAAMSVTATPLPQESGGMTPAEVTEEVAPPADVPAEETAASTVVEAYSTAADAPVEPLATVSAAWSGETQAPPPPKNFGPVGKLNSPSDWTQIKSSPYGNGGIWIDYTPVRQNQARTYSISVTMQNFDSSNYWNIAPALAVNPKSNKVNAYLHVGEGVCGYKELLVEETQRWRGSTRTFLSKRVPIYINCDSGDQYANY